MADTRRVFGGSISRAAARSASPINRMRPTSARSPRVPPPHVRCFSTARGRRSGAGRNYCAIFSSARRCEATTAAIPAFASRANRGKLRNPWGIAGYSINSTSTSAFSSACA